MKKLYGRLAHRSNSDFLKGLFSGFGLITPLVGFAVLFALKRSQESQRISAEHTTEMRKRFKELREEENARERKQNKVFAIVATILVVTTIIPLATVAANF